METQIQTIQQQEPKEESSKWLSRKFVAKEKTVLNPKLNVLGDMTPEVETVLQWLGIKDQNVIPRATHYGLTDPLEAILIACFSASEILDKLFHEK